MKQTMWKPQIFVDYGMEERTKSTNSVKTTYVTFKMKELAMATTTEKLGNKTNPCELTQTQFKLTTFSYVPHFNPFTPTSKKKLPILKINMNSYSNFPK